MQKTHSWKPAENPQLAKIRNQWQAYTMSNQEKLIQAQIDRGMTRKQACSLLGVPYTPEKAADAHDKDALRAMAIDTLASLVNDMQKSPAAFKPNEIIAACKEALDRTEGKPLQTSQVNQSVSYTIISNIPAPPNVKAREMRAIDVEGEILPN